MPRNHKQQSLEYQVWSRKVARNEAGEVAKARPRNIINITQES